MASGSRQMYITTTASCNDVTCCGNILSLILMLFFLGPTERENLANLDDIVEHSLPI